MTEARLRAVCCALLAVIAGCSGEQRATPEGSAGAGPGPSGIRYLAASADDDGDFALALEPRRFEFPADHAPHPDFRTEWWYFTGNVFDAQERHYGFELTIFRLALKPGMPEREAALATNQIWMANLAVTDTAGREFQAAERLSRGAAGLAGATRSPGPAGDALRISVEDWNVSIGTGTIRLDAASDGFAIDLELTGLERIVLQGDAGLDPKGPEPGNASYYYSAPRLAVSGTLRSDGATAVAVSGSAWMDREWSTSALSSDLAGWDWFALQLDDGRDLMFYRLRQADGGMSRFSGGSLVDASGGLTRLRADDVELESTRAWTSAATGIRYPVEWLMRIPSLDLELAVRPRLDDQEIDLTVRYWEGAVRVSGDSGDEPVSGIGYLELAGY